MTKANQVSTPGHALTQGTAIDIPAIPAGVRVVALDNGLTIIIREDHSAPVVSAQAWCKAGSINEGRWLGAGLSHVLEHMLFKGTSTRPGSRIDQEVQEAGGYMNAYTSFDRTVYWINVPNTGAKVAIDILCDIMQNAALPAEELEKEKQVILREMDMNQDDPGQRSAPVLQSQSTLPRSDLEIPSDRLGRHRTGSVRLVLPGEAVVHGVVPVAGVDAAAGSST